MTQCCNQVKLLNTGGDLNVPKVVKSVVTEGRKLVVFYTDGVVYELELPKPLPVNLDEVNIYNASRTKLLVTMAQLK